MRAKKWRIIAWINFFMIWIWGNLITSIRLLPDVLLFPMLIGTLFIIMACLDLAWCIENTSKQEEGVVQEEDYETMELKKAIKDRKIKRLLMFIIPIAGIIITKIIIEEFLL